MALTDKQQVFVTEYLSNGFNATRAAIEAGYSEKTAYSMGARLLKKVEVKEAVQEALEAYAMSTHEVLARLAAMARADMREFIGLTYSDLKRHPDAIAIKKLKRTITRTKTGDTDETYEIELYDAKDALLNLLKELRLDAGKPTERTELDVTKLSDDELRAIVEN